MSVILTKKASGNTMDCLTKANTIHGSLAEAKGGRHTNEQWDIGLATEGIAGI